MHLLGAFSDVKVAHHVENAIRDVTGEESLGGARFSKEQKYMGKCSTQSHMAVSSEEIVTLSPMKTIKKGYNVAE